MSEATIKDVTHALTGVDKKIRVIADHFEGAATKADGVLRDQGKIDLAIVETARAVEAAVLARDQIKLTELAGRLAQQVSNRAQISEAREQILRGATEKSLADLAVIANAAALVAPALSTLVENLAAVPTYVVSALLKATNGRLKL